MANLNTSPEIWVDIPSYSGLYKISTYGRIYFFSKGGGILQIKLGNSGYYTARLFKKGKYWNISLHRLMAIIFIPNPHNKPQVNHKDKNKLNNHLENLEWATQSENMKHSYETTEYCSSRKLTKQQVFEILSLRKKLKFKALKERYQLSFSTLHNICSGKNYNKWFKEYTNGK